MKTDEPQTATTQVLEKEQELSNGGPDDAASTEERENRADTVVDEATPQAEPDETEERIRAAFQSLGSKTSTIQRNSAAISSTTVPSRMPMIFRGLAICFCVLQLGYAHGKTYWVKLKGRNFECANFFEGRRCQRVRAKQSFSSRDVFAPAPCPSSKSLAFHNCPAISSKYMNPRS